MDEVRGKMGYGITPNGYCLRIRSIVADFWLIVSIIKSMNDIQYQVEAFLIVNNKTRNRFLPARSRRAFRCASSDSYRIEMTIRTRRMVRKEK
jgi:hypothetical protein